MSAFAAQDAMAQEILTKHRGKVLAIVKATRAGATTSLLKEAIRRKQRAVIIAPYNKIFKKTVEDVKALVKDSKPKITHLGANVEICRRIKEKIDDYPDLRSLPFHFRPSCTGCNFNDPKQCKLQRILTEDWDVLGLTYKKLLALSICESETNSNILQRLSLANNLILDELATGILRTSPAVRIKAPYSCLESEFDYFNRMLNSSELETSFWGGIAEFAVVTEEIGQKLANKEHKVFENTILDDYGDVFRESYVDCWKIIEQLTIDGKNTRPLQQILQIIGAKRFVISRREDKVTVTPIEELSERSARSSMYLRNFVSAYLSKDKEKKVVTLVDACLPEMNLSEAFGLPVESYIWGDPLETNKSQAIICDTRKIGKIEFFKEKGLQPKLKLLINFACKIHTPSAVLIATLSEDMADVVEQWKTAKEIPRGIDVTWYRSDLSRGITIDTKHRFLILIGGPYIPKIAYLAETYDLEDKAEAMQRAFRSWDMRSAFINLIGRVKDPNGRQKSVVFAAGIPARDVRAFIVQKDIHPPLIFDFLVKGADSLDFEFAANLFLHAHELTEEWGDLEKDLPVLAEILRVCRYRDKSLSSSEILSKDSERINKFIENYPDVLKRFKIEIVKEARGCRLIPR